MRHGERLDAVDPVGWYRSPAGQEYPFDCPLSSRGRMQVGNAARELAQRSSAAFSYVVTSPFIRCVETAVEVCRALKLPICIDMQLGEVFGPACFGEWSAPGPNRRNAEEVASFVPADLRKITPVDSIGKEPTWPESIEDARLRMVARVEQYTEWAARLEGVNFVLVTHGDCVGACLTLALARGDQGPSRVVEKVDYCGYALLERTWEPGEPSLGLMDETAQWEVQHGNVILRERALTSQREVPQDEAGAIETRGLRACLMAQTPLTLLTSRTCHFKSMKTRQAELARPRSDVQPKTQGQRHLESEDLDLDDFSGTGYAWDHCHAMHGAAGL